MLKKEIVKFLVFSGWGDNRVKKEDILVPDYVGLQA